MWVLNTHFVAELAGCLWTEVRGLIQKCPVLDSFEYYRELDIIFEKSGRFLLLYWLRTALK